MTILIWQAVFEKMGKFNLGFIWSIGCNLTCKHQNEIFPTYFSVTPTHTKFHWNPSSSFRDETCGCTNMTSTLYTYFMHLVQRRNKNSFTYICLMKMKQCKWCLYQMHTKKHSYQRRQIYINLPLPV